MRTRWESSLSLCTLACVWGGVVFLYRWQLTAGNSKPSRNSACGVVWWGVVWCGVVCVCVWCGVCGVCVCVWCGVVWCVCVCGVVWCGVVSCAKLWCGVCVCVVWCVCGG